MLVIIYEGSGIGIGRGGVRGQPPTAELVSQAMRDEIGAHSSSQHLRATSKISHRGVLKSIPVTFAPPIGRCVTVAALKSKHG